MSFSQLYSEELITTCLSTIKNQLTKIVYPFVEASQDLGGQLSPLLQYLHKTSAPDVREHRRQLSEIFQALTAVMPRINNLICAETVVMSDAIIIQTVYIAIGPFFVVESGSDGDAKGKKQNIVLSTLGSSAMRGLRLDALSLIRNVSYYRIS
jgi:cohesin loading factor subunit SCC2